MKIRNGFVSNSSSSSFICDYCGSEASGWDMTLEEAEMFQCQNGHIFCRHHSLDNSQDYIKAIQLFVKKSNHIDKKVMEMSNENFLDWFHSSDNKNDFYFNFPKEFCPLCNFEEVADKDLLTYLLILINKTNLETRKEMKHKFSSWEDFEEFLKMSEIMSKVIKKT